MNNSNSKSDQIFSGTKMETYDIKKLPHIYFKFRKVVNFLDHNLGYVMAITVICELLRLPFFFSVTGFLLMMYLITRRLTLNARKQRKIKG